jgi:hypothetical protein
VVTFLRLGLRLLLVHYISFVFLDDVVVYDFLLFLNLQDFLVLIGFEAQSDVLDASHRLRHVEVGAEVVDLFFFFLLHGRVKVEFIAE